MAAVAVNSIPLHAALATQAAWQSANVLADVTSSAPAYARP